MALTLVLSVGQEPDLMGTRSLVLQSAGYVVVSAYSMKEAVDRFQEGDFDLVLLCQSIPTRDRDRLTSWIRASGSRIPVVSVSGQVRQDDGFDGVTVGSEPGALLWGIREVLIEAEISASRTAAPRSSKGQTAAQGKKPRSSIMDYERQTETIGERLIPFARTG